MTGKLTVTADGRVTGPASITHNDPWPCGNGTSGGMSVPSGVMGLLVHTMVGNLPGTVTWFNESQSQASAHFGVDQAGNIHQFGPVNGWKAWHAADGNPHWYGCEFADDGNPSNPLTQAQIVAAAQLLECLSSPDVGRFSLQITDSVNTEGLGWHGMGGQAFGGHFQCPGPVRAAQRPQIVALAMSIRQGAAAPAPERWTSEGMLSLHDLAAAHLFSDVATVLALTARSSPGAAFAPGLARYIDTVFAADPARCPAGVTWHYPGKAGQASTWVTKGELSLQALSAQLGTVPSAILQVTADVAAGGKLQGLAAGYIDGVFSRSALHVPAGAVLFYGP